MDRYDAWVKVWPNGQGYPMSESKEVRYQFFEHREMLIDRVVGVFEEDGDEMYPSNDDEVAVINVSFPVSTLIKLSQEFPEDVFVITLDSKEYPMDHLSRVYMKGGKVHWVWPEYVFPSFDESQLEDHNGGFIA